MTDSQHPDLDMILADLPPAEADRLRDVWHLVGSEEPVAASRNAEAALQQFNRALDQQEALTSTVSARQSKLDRRARAPHRKGRWQRIGAALVALLIVGALGRFWWTQPVTQTAPLGERLTVTLPDGSTAELNSGSSLRYARHFSDTRLVDLQGEAFFEVVKETRPFVVRTFNAQVEVLGTQFNVQAWPHSEERSSTVALASGRVAVAPRSNLKAITTLEPGQTHRIVSVEETGATVALSVEDAMAWRRGDFVFKNQRVPVVLEEVERRYAVDIVLQAPSIRTTRLSLALRQPADAEAVVRDLVAPLGLAYRATADGFEVYAPTP